MEAFELRCGGKTDEDPSEVAATVSIFKSLSTLPYKLINSHHIRRATVPQIMTLSEVSTIFLLMRQVSTTKGIRQYLVNTRYLCHDARWRKAY